ncbi:MAG: NAD-binding protein [Candidatus Levyibacteriota bacterium]
MQSSESQHQLVLFGFDRVGHDFVEAFQKLEKDYLVIDYNPDMIADLEIAQMPFRYGDVEDIEFLQELQLQKIKLCVSTIPNVKANLLLIKHIRAINKKAIIIVRARELEDAKRLYKHGATYVLMPHYLGAKYATHMITRLGLDEREFQEEREKHLTDINKRKN